MADPARENKRSTGAGPIKSSSGKERSKVPKKQKPTSGKNAQPPKPTQPPAASKTTVNKAVQPIATQAAITPPKPVVAAASNPPALSAKQKQADDALNTPAANITPAPMSFYRPRSAGEPQAQPSTSQPAGASQSFERASYPPSGGGQSFVAPAPEAMAAAVPTLEIPRVVEPAPVAPPRDPLEPGASAISPAQADLAEPAPVISPALASFTADQQRRGARSTPDVSISVAKDDIAPSREEDVEPPPAPVIEQPAQEPLLFEVAWEVCWQLGGIYTVLKTKAPTMLQRWGERYCLVGPYNPATASLEFEEQAPTGIFKEALDRLRNDFGIHAKFGRWLIAGRPQTILIEHHTRYGSLPDDKYLLWKDHGISTTNDDGEVNDVVAFGFACAELFNQLAKVAGNRKILAHFHEWMGGVAVPRIAHRQIPIATVFTTHATLLGRYLASDQPNFYSNLQYIDPDREAAKYNIYPRFSIERSAAHSCTVFTTVSEVTATEAEKLLGRKPDAIVPNGLNIQRFAALHEFQNLHREYKERIHEFVMGHFFPNYSFDLDRTLYLFTAGRYEYRNKGMDLFLESLFRLNQRLKQMPDRPTVVAFIVTRAWTRHINVGVLQRRSMFEEMKRTCGQLERQMGGRLFRAAAHGRTPKLQDLLSDDELVRLRQSIAAWRKGPPPSIVTHDLVDDANDPILQHLRHRGMFNGPDDPVKVVFHPEFVTATSPLIGLDYEQFVRGCHMGIFPSYYEPWGYTPMESAALGLPAVTTDLSGFGAYVEHHIDKASDQGICVLNRTTKGFEETTNNLTDFLHNFCQMSRRQRIEMRNKVERLSELFDWSALGVHYHEAHDLALQRVGASGTGANRSGQLEVRMV